MKRNMGHIDRTLRVLVAIAIGVLIYLEVISGPLAYVALGIAAVFVLTSMVGVCPAYLPFGMKTCKTKPAPSQKST